MMPPIRDDEPSAEESVEYDVGFGRARNTSPVSTRVGRNIVEIDVSALRHLVNTIKVKLRPRVDD
jgi:hypothetical protein